jgi:hypothetical protein
MRQMPDLSTVDRRERVPKRSCPLWTLRDTARSDTGSVHYGYRAPMASRDIDLALVDTDPPMAGVTLPV